MKNVSNVRKGLTLLCSLAFFLVLFFMDGVLVSRDTDSYVYFTFAREPLYPSFLAFFRFFFGENYFTVVVLVQCLLAAYAVYRVTVVIDNRFHLDTLSFLTIPFFQYAVVLLCRFVASRQATYCNEICSEGLSIPLFALFMAEVFQYIWYRKGRNLLALMLYATALILVRKQMYIVIVIMALISISLSRLLFKKIPVKRFIISLLAIGGAICLSVGGELLYGLCVRGEAMRHTSDSSALLVTVLYCSGSEDSIYFEDTGIATLYSDIMKEVEEEKYNYKFADGSWLDWYEHYSNHFDLIGYGVVNPHFYGYLETNYELSNNQRELAFDELNSTMINTLLSKNFFRICKVTFFNMLAGVCNTISKAHVLLNWYNALFVVLYLVLMVRCMVRKKNPDLAWFSFMIVAATAINVGAVGVMIFAQGRYMIYNMPFVYIAMYLLIRDFVREKWNISAKKTEVET